MQDEILSKEATHRRVNAAILTVRKEKLGDGGIWFPLSSNKKTRSFCVPPPLPPPDRSVVGSADMMDVECDQSAKKRPAGDEDNEQLVWKSLCRRASLCVCDAIFVGFKVSSCSVWLSFDMCNFLLFFGTCSFCRGCSAVCWALPLVAAAAVLDDDEVCSSSNVSNDILLGATSPAACFSGSGS